MAFAFEKLLVYRKAVDFADRTSSLTESFPRGYGFRADQIDRAALTRTPRNQVMMSPTSPILGGAPHDMRSVVTILLVALGLRLFFALSIFLLNPSGAFDLDSASYWNMAANLSAGHGFSQETHTPYYLAHARTPAYSLFLLPWLRLGSAAALAVVACQVALSCLTALAVYRLLVRYGNGWPGAFLGALLVALDVPSAFMASQIMTETVFTFLMLVGSLLFLEGILEAALEKRGPGRFLLAGVLAGLATLVRPITQFVVLAFLPMVVLSRQTVRERLGQSLLFFGAFLCLVLPWVARNFDVFGVPFLSSIGWRNMLSYRAAGVVAMRDRIPLEEAQARLQSEAESTFRGDRERRPVEFLRHGSSLGRRVLLENPALAFRMHLRGDLNMLLRPMRSSIDVALGLRDRSTLVSWGAAERPGWWRRVRGNTSTLTVVLVGFQLMWLLVCYGLALAGAACGLLRRTPIVWLSGLMILYFLLVSGGPEAYARFRVPIVPFVAILAGIGYNVILTHLCPPTIPALLNRLARRMYTVGIGGTSGRVCRQALTEEPAQAGLLSRTVVFCRRFQGLGYGQPAFPGLRPRHGAATHRAPTGAPR
jgi:hypothetical protein